MLKLRAGLKHVPLKCGVNPCSGFTPHVRKLWSDSKDRYYRRLVSYDPTGL